MEKIKESGILPVIVIDDVKTAEPLAQALLDGGIGCAEVTFRTKEAAAAIRVMKRNFPELTVCAGTVLTNNQVDEAVEAGAEFLVSPGLNPEVVRYCKSKGISIVPGVNNPSDIECALSLGLHTVKFFPAEASGGIDMIKALAAPYPDIMFMPTGGISMENVKKYLEFNRVLACGGSWMVKENFIREGQFDRIRELCCETKKIVRDVRKGQ